MLLGGKSCAAERVTRGRKTSRGRSGGAAGDARRGKFTIETQEEEAGHGRGLQGAADELGSKGDGDAQVEVAVQTRKEATIREESAGSGREEVGVDSVAEIGRRGCGRSWVARAGRGERRLGRSGVEAVARPRS